VIKYPIHAHTSFYPILPGKYRPHQFGRFYEEYTATLIFSHQDVVWITMVMVEELWTRSEIFSQPSASQPVQD
jgi:hypothetical protein